MSAPRVFDDVVLPVLIAKCASCHGADMAKGQLRLDSFEALMKGGKAGPAALVGDATRSLVVRRITSSITDDAHMPPEGKPQLTPEEIELIVLWTDGGASSATKVRDLIVPDGARRLLVKAAERASESAHVEAGAASVPAATLAPVPSTTTREAPSPPTTTPASSGDADFGARIAPILAAKCGRCHGAEKQKGKLRTDSLAALFEGGESGPAIASRDPGRGTLLTRIRLPVEDAQHMPPRDAPQLDASEIRLLSRWLARSAVSGSPASRRSEAPSERATIARERIATASSPDESTRLFVEVVQPILLNRCGACHSGAHPSGGFVIADRDALLARSYVLPGDPTASPLFSRMASPLTDEDHMPPKRAPQPSQAEIDAVRLWIERGASVSGVDAKDAPPVLARTPNATSVGSPEEEEEPSPTVVAVQRANVRGGCAGCAVNRSDVPERLAFGGGPLLLALLALRRRSSLRAQH